MAKWEGKVSTTLTKASLDKIWPLFTDFFNFHKWFPNMSTCYGIHGVNGEVGCIRYCVGFVFENDDGVREANWVKARLVAIDPNEMSLSYEILECNFGFNESFLGTFKVVRGEAQGCVVEWSFIVDPVEGVTWEYFVEKYQNILDQMTKKMEVEVVEKDDL
ncbi:hypothetical protein L1887_31618 [Cichorium endivia]|nr:hypothetical protein L1887_31618 [Cichorium endivia]